jgi:hypothetical protein
VASADPRYALVAVACLTGLGMVVAYRYTTNGAAIRRSKDRMQAHLLALRLFQDVPGVVLRAQARLLRASLAYMLHSLPALLVVLVPMVVLLGQLDARLGWRPLRPGESFVLTGRVADVATLTRWSVRVPPGLTLATPPVRSTGDRAIAWRLRADTAGTFAPQLLLDGHAFDKAVAVGTDLVPVSPARARADWLAWVWQPAEPPLPSDAPLETIEVTYRRRTLDFGVFEGEWLGPFLVLSLVAALVMKAVLRTEM